MPELQTLCQSCAITFANAKDFFSVNALSSFYFKRIKNTTFYDQGSVTSLELERKSHKRRKGSRRPHVNGWVGMSLTKGYRGMY